MDGSIEVNSHYVSKGFDITIAYLEMKKKILIASPDIVIIIDPFARANIEVCQILENLEVDAPFKYCYYNLNGDEFRAPDGHVILKDVEALKTAISKHKNVMVIAPRTIRHVVFVASVIEGIEHPAYNNLGELNFDARWMLKKSSNGNFDALLRNSVGYAMPYPDATGDGIAILDEYRAAASGMDYGVNSSMAEERVENSVRLARSFHRFIVQAPKFIHLNACDFGSYHTGTLVAELSEKYPDVERVLIHNVRDSVAKKTGEMQYTLVKIHNDNSKVHFKGYDGKISNITPLMVRLDKFPTIAHLNDEGNVEY